MSESKNDGGPAFPFELRHQKVLPSGQAIGPVSTITHHGMTLRDWFAGQALAGILAFPGAVMGNRDKSKGACVSAAYAYADAMIAERSKP